MKTINPKAKWILLAAIAAVPVAGVPASAQYQSQQDGSALDANRRLGDDYRNTGSSGYRIDTRIRSLDRPTGNQIVTGNVTGNRQFRGNVGYTDAREFRGATATDASDSFIRSSAGTAGAAFRRNDYNVSVPFYPSGRTVQPPPGFVQSNVAGGGYLPRDVDAAISGRVDNRIDRGAITPRGGSLILTPIQPQGTISDQARAASMITASPLLGVQQMPYGAPGSAYTQFAGAGRGLLDQATVERMRNELRTGAQDTSTGTDNAQPNLPNAPQLPGQGADTAQQTYPGQVNGGRGVGSPDATGANAGSGQAAQAGGPINAQALGSQTVSANAATAIQSTRQRLLPTPGEQTPAYRELRRRLDQIANDKTMTDEQAHRAAQAARKQAELANQRATPAQDQLPGQPGQPTAPAQPGQPAQPAKDQPGASPQQQSRAEGIGLQDFAKQNEQILKGGGKTNDADTRGAANSQQVRLPSGDVTPAPLPPAGATPAPAPAAQPELRFEPKGAAPAQAPGAKAPPVKIDSLAKGVPGKGLGELLSGAESLMKEGKFSSALEKYDQAEQVAPNNPLIKLGRANAELGASYFARADEHLREAFAADEALLMGQYDLRTFLGEDRLKVIANDLKDIANKEQSQVRPVFLLAYIAYNTGNERMAGGYLDLAEQRAGGKDPLIQKIRQRWTLPAAGEAPAAEPAAKPAEQTAPAEQAPEKPDRSQQTK
jgi:hypothetical protein